MSTKSRTRSDRSSMVVDLQCSPKFLQSSFEMGLYARDPYSRQFGDLPQVPAKPVNKHHGRTLRIGEFLKRSPETWFNERLVPIISHEDGWGHASAAAALPHPEEKARRIVHPLDARPVLPRPGEGLGGCFSTTVQAKHREEGTTKPGLNPSHERLELLLVGVPHRPLPDVTRRERPFTTDISIPDLRLIDPYTAAGR